MDMLTGVETAGLVLAAFPLLISALEHYRDGFEPLKAWWEFRTEFLGFLHVLGVQSALFYGNLEELLRDVVDSDIEMDALLNDPLGTAWQKPGLENCLRERLPRSYEWYRSTIGEMNQIMEELKKKLGIEDGEVCAGPCALF